MTTYPSTKPWLKFYHPNTPEHLTYPDGSLHSLLANTALQYPSKIATRFVLRYMANGRVTVGGKLTYSQLNQMVDQFAASLAKLGVKKGDRIALMLPNSPHFVITFFAAMRLGAIIVNTNPTYTARELKNQLVDSGAETIVLLNLFYPRLEEIIKETSVKNTVVVHIYDTLAFPFNRLVHSKQRKEKEWVDVSPKAGVHFFEPMVKGNAKPPATNIDPNDVALFQYTGGTTGLPKAAMLTHRNLVTNVYQTIAWDPTRQRGQEKVMSAIPFFHVYGMTVCMLYGVATGSEMVIVPNPRPIDNVMRIIAHERCTIYPGVPAMYIGIVNHPRISEFDLTCIKLCISGSAALPMEIQDKFYKLTKGGYLVEGYGLTEASPVTHCNPVIGKRNGSIGLPYPDTDVKIINLDGSSEIHDPNETGELLVRGPQVMKGYWNRPEETANMIDSEGWLHTGDIAKMDTDGYFYIVDRKKDMINVGGLKVLPRDVEEVLFTHPKILEAVVVGIPNPQRGDDTLKAYIVLKPDIEATADEIKSHLIKDLAPHKIPREFEFRKELPKTQVGKVLRRVLIEEEMQKAK